MSERIPFRARAAAPLQLTAVIIGVIWLLLQVIAVIVYKDIPQGFDAIRYQQLAERMASAGEWYPTVSQIENPAVLAPYIIYPGFINYLILMIRITGTISSVFWINIVWNIVYATSGSYIASRLSDKRIGYLYFILFCLSHQNVLDVVFTLSELPALTLAYAAGALCIPKRRITSFAAGILFGVSYYFRPSALLIIITATILLFTLKQARVKLPSLLAGVALTMGGVLIVNHHVSEKYWFVSSNTLGINMYLGANDESMGLTGGTTDSQLDSEIYSHNSLEADSIYRTKAKEWILANPGKWCLLGVKKLRHQITTDNLIHMYRTRENPVLTYDDNIIIKCIKIAWIWYPGIYDLILGVLCIYGIWRWRSRFRDGYWPILLPIAGTLMLCILTIADYRYNATMMPVIYFLGAVGLNGLIRGLFPGYNKTRTL